RLERVITEVIEGPGIEDTPLPQPDDLPGPADLPGLRPVAAPCLRLPSLSFPVHEYLAAVRRGEDPAPPAPRPVCLVVNRRDYKVTMRELDPAAHRALRALAGGATVGAAFASAPGTACADVGEPRPAALLHRWTELAFFSGFHEPGGGTITPTRKGAP
ncbi:hypothetical protein, partial [Actinomadura soli]|uniref:hypothetical protein n=1 Tax=Actinomadura soli TaxID=2508997 RepID=UPI00197ADD65